MAITKLSPEAQFISDIVAHAGCVTVDQVIQIMSDIKEEIKEDTTRKMINILCKKQLLKIHKDKYLTPYFGSLKLDIIPSIWFFINRVSKQKNAELSKEANMENLMNTWRSMFEAEHPDKLCIFITDNNYQKTTCYTTCNIDTTTTSIIDMKEIKYKSDKSLIKSQKSLKDAVQYNTVFIIHNAEDQSEWASIFSDKIISFDYYICFITDNPNSPIPQIDVYKKAE